MQRKINASSFTPKYDELEDRIRISINYDEIYNRVDLMMSRAFVLKLFPTVDEYMLQYYELDLATPTQTNTNINEDENRKEIMKDTHSTSKTDGVNLELYKQEDELIREVKFSYNRETKMTIVQFHSNNSIVISHLDKSSMKQVFNILKSVIPFFSWGISHNI